MEWVLVILTFWRPEVAVKTTEMYFPDEQSCIAQMAVLEERYANYVEQQDYKGFGYILSCQPRDDEEYMDGH